MPRIRLASLTLCAALGIAVGSPAAAQVNDSDIGIDLTVGRAVQRDGDRLLALGLNVAYLPAGWWIQPEVGYEAKLFPLFGGEDNEVTAGLRSEWPVGTGRLWVGGGYAKLRRHWGSEVDHSEGWYARAGAMWPVGRGGSPPRQPSRTGPQRPSQPSSKSARAWAPPSSSTRTPPPSCTQPRTPCPRCRRIAGRARTASNSRRCRSARCTVA